MYMFRSKSEKCLNMMENLPGMRVENSFVIGLPIPNSPEREREKSCECLTSTYPLFTGILKVWTPKEWSTKSFPLICSDKSYLHSCVQWKMTFQHDGRKMTLLGKPLCN